MNFNYFTIAALPELTWNSPLPCTTIELLEEYKIQFDPLKDGISDIMLLNDVKNIELILRQRTETIPEEYKSNMMDGPVEYYKARFVEPEDLEDFMEDTFLHRPADTYPEFMGDYLERYKGDEERFDHIDELYIAYFGYLQTRQDGFLRYYGRIASVMRTALSAARILHMGKDLESHLKGDYYIVQTILENKTSSDFGLHNIFPEIGEMMALLDKDPKELELDLDRIRFELMKQVGQETPFADHIIYSYIIGFQVRNRWNTLDKARGELILDNIITG